MADNPTTDSSPRRDSLPSAPQAPVWGGTSPPEPLVVLSRLALPDGPAGRLLGAAAPQPVLGAIGTTSPPTTVGERAVAAALSTTARSGWLARQVAAWIWTGQALVRPDVIEVASNARVVLTDRQVLSWAAVATRTVRPTARSRVVQVAGVAVADPATTAVECARLLEAPMAVACLRALVQSGRCSVATARAMLGRTAPGRRRQQALAALTAVERSVVAGDLPADA